ncbi:MAG TPA: DNA internalization-related competence protein ComEC/Rec2 [Casimicrobiaceae bacterium]|nr:DNA internalization-related competence protein ComEC/Rec2 [Casimicrobiaceae bacterium]
MSFPVAGVLAGFATGATALQACAQLPWAPWPGAVLALCATLASLALVARCLPATPGRHVWMVLAVGASAWLGYFYAAGRAESRLADALPAAWEDRDLRVTGVVDDLPHNDGSGARFAFAIERVRTPGAVVPRRVSLAWFAPRANDDAVRPPPPAVRAGERWTLTLRLKRPHGNVNPHGFDLEAWLLERNFRATGYVRDDPANARESAFAARPGDHVERARERIRERIEGALADAPYRGVLAALAIGDQRAIPEAQWGVFNRTGITHLVSISGLHVTVFATLAGGCALALARRSAALTSRIPARKVAAVVGTVAAGGYVMLAGAEVPAMRTLLMLLVAAAGLWLGRPGTAALVWLWSLCAVLAWDPWAGLAPGFWLSFGAVGLLLYAGGGRLRAVPAAGWRARAATVLREAARAQWVVTLGLVPGTLALFHQVSIASALANALAIPVVTLLVVPLALTGIVLPMDLPWRLAHFVLEALMRWLETLAASPHATWASHAPREWTVAVAIAGMLWLFAPRGVPGRPLGMLFALPMLLLPPPGVPESGARIVVLDVGQGLAVFVSTAHHAMLYDTGPRFTDAVDAGGRIVVPFLHAIGVAKLDLLVVSHADTDHSGGALSVLKAVPVASMMSSLPGGHPLVAAMAGTRSTVAARNGALTDGRSGVDASSAVATAAIPCVAGDRWQWDGVAFEVMHPARSAYRDAERKSNDLSCVLRIVSKGGRVLLTGDIEAVSEHELLARDASALAADVLVVPHHGSRTSSTPAFIAAVSPRSAVVAAGYHNRFGHPRGEILARYVRAGAGCPRTDLEGGITVLMVPGKPIAMTAERDRRRRYWYDIPGSSCAAPAGTAPQPT